MRLILAIFLLAGGSFYGLSLQKETNEKVLQEIEQNDERVETQKSNKKDAKTWKKVKNLHRTHFSM